jgi:hypothetical protein
MCWASRRETTRPEDMAYSLLGIFQINMTLIYGEGSTGAFIRLQEHIMQDSDDQSIFAWTSHRHSKRGRDLGLLADSPRRFQDSGNIMAIRDWHESEPYHMTNKGLRLNLHLVPQPTHFMAEAKSYLGALTCRATDDPLHVAGILLSRVHSESDQYVRKDGKIYQIPIRSLLSPHEGPFRSPSGSSGTGLPLAENQKQRIYVRKRILYPESEEITSPGDFKSFRIYVPQHGASTDPILPYLSASLYHGNIESWPVEIRSPRTHQFRWNPLIWSWHSVLILFSQSPRVSFYLAVGWDGEKGEAWAHLGETDHREFSVVYSEYCPGRPAKENRDITVTWGVSDYSISISQVETERDDNFCCYKITLQGKPLVKKVAPPQKGTPPKGMLQSVTPQEPSASRRSSFKLWKK